VVALNVLRIHSDRVCLLALAAVLIKRRSPGLNRTGTILALALSFGNFGRPTFLAFFCCAKVPLLLIEARFQRNQLFAEPTEMHFYFPLAITVLHKL
jgi:hypothetical protein